MAQDINHRNELKDLPSDLLEVIAHHCKGEARVCKGHAINYHIGRGDMARLIINERRIEAINKSNIKDQSSQID